MLKLTKKNAKSYDFTFNIWCTISGRVKNSVLSACRPLRPPFCFAKPLVRLYAARGVHCSLPAFAPRFRSRSIVAPAHKPATIFSDQSPRDEHERLREVRVRPEGNGAAKKPQHLLRLFLVHHRGLSRALKTPHWGVFARRTGGGPELFSSPDAAPD